MFGNRSGTRESRQPPHDGPRSIDFIGRAGESLESFGVSAPHSLHSDRLRALGLMTEVWFRLRPDHLVHFNREKFLWALEAER